ncbi:hypothetical protein H4R33_005892 [Dimargaris cristalligena]|nr:hypothetical protein H4R33_005892 [Dimargaris cristalligena]
MSQRSSVALFLRSAGLYRCSLGHHRTSQPIRPSWSVRSFHSSPASANLWGFFKGDKKDQTPAEDPQSVLNQEKTPGPIDPVTANASSLQSQITQAPDLDLSYTDFSTLPLPTAPEPSAIEAAVKDAVLTFQPAEALESAADWRSLSLGNSQQKLDILRHCMETLRIDVPNRDLSNMTTAQQALDFFLGKEEVTVLAKVHEGAKYFRENLDSLPDNMTFVPHIRKKPHEIAAEKNRS